MILLRQCVVLFMCLAFFNANALGAHLHLCLDGQSPPASTHLYDAHERTEPTARFSQDHNDVELKITQKARTAKVFKFNPPSAAATHSWVVPIVSPTATLVVADFEDSHSLPDPRYLLPPLRGPPV